MCELDLRLGHAHPSPVAVEALDGRSEVDGHPLAVDSASEVKQIVQALQDIWSDLNSATANTSLRSRVNQVTGPSASQRSGLLSGSGGTPAPGTPSPAATQACDDFVDRVGPIVSAWSDKERQHIEISLGHLADVTMRK